MNKLSKTDEYWKNEAFRQETESEYSAWNDTVRNRQSIFDSCNGKYMQDLVDKYGYEYVAKRFRMEKELENKEK